MLDKDLELPMSSIRELVSRHTALCRRIVFDALDNNNTLPIKITTLLLCSANGPKDALGLTPSMSFSMDVLRRISASESLLTNVPNKFFLNSVVLPLVRRIFKKHVKADQFEVMVEIFEHTVAYLSKNHTVGGYLSFKRRQLGWLAVKYWSSAPTRFEKYLRDFIEVQNVDRRHLIEHYRPAFEDVALNRRSQLLMLILKCSALQEIDLGSADCLRNLGGVAWPLWLFHYLPRKEARILLSRLISGRSMPDANGPFSITRSSYGYSVVSEANSQEEGLLRTALERGEDRALDRASAAIEDQKKSAATAREQSIRAGFAESALFYAITSGSLKLYLETLLWTKRFIKDPLTSRTLFAAATLEQTESVDMLVSLPPPKRAQGTTRSEHAKAITSAIATATIDLPLANKILLTLFSFARSAIREPSFQAHHWKSVL